MDGGISQRRRIIQKFITDTKSVPFTSRNCILTWEISGYHIGAALYSCLLDIASCLLVNSNRSFQGPWCLHRQVQPFQEDWKWRHYEMLNVSLMFYDEYLLAKKNSDLLGIKRTRQKVKVFSTELCIIQNNVLTCRTCYFQGEFTRFTFTFYSRCFYCSL